MGGSSGFRSLPHDERSDDGAHDDSKSDWGVSYELSTADSKKTIGHVVLVLFNECNGRISYLKLSGS
jgi:hypothetical protein